MKILLKYDARVAIAVTHAVKGMLLIVKPRRAMLPLVVLTILARLNHAGIVLLTALLVAIPTSIDAAL